MDGLLGVAGIMTLLVMTGIIPENSMVYGRYNELVNGDYNEYGGFRPFGEDLYQVFGENLYE